MTDTNVRTVNPNCRWFHWIGQQLSTCDQCGAPIWEHEGISKAPKSPFGDEPFTGSPWKEADRWYRMHQRWLAGWEIEVEGTTIHVREPQPVKAEDIEDKRITIYPAVSVADVVFGLSRELTEPEMLQFVKMIDQEMSSVEFTEALFEYFKAEMEMERRIGKDS